MKIKKPKFGVLELSYLPLIFSAVVTVVIVRGIYNQSQDILKDTLRARLVAIVSTAALQFDPEEIEAIRDESQLDTKELRNVVNVMNKVRSANENLRYIYIWRKTNDPQFLEFVADAETLDPIDTDGNGSIEDDELPPLPGEKYGIDQIPEPEHLFDYPLAQKDFIIDRWGTFLSGSAPILDKSGRAIAVLGVDIEVGEFFQIMRVTFIPFVLLTVALLFLLSIQTVILIRIWRSRVDVLNELDRQKDELLGIVAHQLAKPITAIRWDLESLLDGDLGSLNAEQKTEAGTMRTQAINLADLVSMILDVSRIQLGKIHFDPRPLDLNELFTEMLEVINPTIEQKKINFVNNMPKTLPTVFLDKRYTRMTIENLLTNAVKYTPQGGTVTLDIVIEKGVMHCKVTDTGCGIPKADQSKIFGKMYRASNVVNTVDGNGFGLYVAKGAVEGQGGTIGFESTEGKGTTFFFTLPMKEAPKKGE